MWTSVYWQAWRSFLNYYYQAGNTNFRLTFNLMIIINQLNYSI